MTLTVYLLLGVLLGCIVLFEKDDDLTPLEIIKSVLMQLASVLMMVGTFVGFVLLWPVMLVWAWVNCVRRDFRHIKTPQYIEPQVFMEHWLKKGHRRFGFIRGRWVVIGQWLNTPSFPVRYLPARNSSLHGPTWTIWLGIVGVGITRVNVK